MSMRVAKLQNNVAFKGLKFNEDAIAKDGELTKKLATDKELSAIVGKATVNVDRQFSGGYIITKKSLFGLLKKEAYAYGQAVSFENIAKEIKGLFKK